MEEVLAKALARIKPSKAERQRDYAVADKVMHRLRRVLPKGITTELVGSIAKNTNLRGDRDIDVFLLFPKSYSRKSLETLGLRYAKKAIAPAKWRMHYAEHPYIKTSISGCDVELVPSYGIKRIEEMGTAVDRSPMHTRYVNARISEGMCDDVRLLKQFLKRLDVYGAELRVEGFSGYLCELLVLHHGSLAQLLRAAADWNAPVLCEEPHAQPELRERFKGAALVVIDPVDPERNVAAAVSETSLSRFIAASRAFLRSPSEEFFFGTAQAQSAAQMRSMMKARGTDFALLQFAAPDVVPDILWPQLKSTQRKINAVLQRQDFALLDSACFADAKRCALLFEFLVSRLPAAQRVAGPPVVFAQGVGEFVKRHAKALSGPFIDGGRVVTMEKREHADACALLAEIAKNASRHGIPSHVAPQMKKARIHSTGIEKHANAAFLSGYLQRREFFW